jgi:hypothetical protein
MFDIWEIRLLRVYFCATALLAAPMTVECSVLRVEALQFAFDEGRLRFATEHCKDQSAISGQFLKSSQTFLQAMSQASGAPLALLEARQKEGYESAQKGPRLDDNACARMLKELPTHAIS